MVRNCKRTVIVSDTSLPGLTVTLCLIRRNKGVSSFLPFTVKPFALTLRRIEVKVIKNIQTYTELWIKRETSVSKHWELRFYRDPSARSAGVTKNTYFWSEERHLLKFPVYTRLEELLVYKR